MKGLWTRLYRKILKKNVGLTWCGENFLKKYLKEKKVRRVAGNIIEKIVGERGQRVILNFF